VVCVTGLKSRGQNDSQVVSFHRGVVRIEPHFIKVMEGLINEQH